MRNEYVATENRILKAQIKGRLLLSDAEKKTLAEMAHRLGRKALEDVANAAKPDTILGWYRKLIARKFDRSKARRYPGRPRVDCEIEDLAVFGLNATKPYEVTIDEVKLRSRGDKIARERLVYGERADPHFRTYGPKTRREFLNFLSHSGGWGT